MTVMSQSAPPVLGPAPMGSILPLRLDDVGYSAGGKALIEHVSFEIAAGPRTVMLGPNGAGKSLILRLCHGLIRPTSGRVLWLGPDEHLANRYASAKAWLRKRYSRGTFIYSICSASLLLAETGLAPERQDPRAAGLVRSRPRA